MRRFLLLTVLVIAIATIFELPLARGADGAHPLIRITGYQLIDWVILVAGYMLFLYVMQAVRLAREGLKNFAVNLITTGFLAYAFQSILLSNHVQDSVAKSLAGLFVIPAYFFIAEVINPRSRHIPISVRREVIARDLRGKPFDPSKHHIDHVWPFWLGGSHSAENLRVIAKEKNLKKGGKRPRIWEMW